MAKQEMQTIELLRKPEMLAEIKRALPRHLTPDRFARMILTSIRRTPELARCDQRSFLGAMMELAQLGLEPDTPLGHAWIVPFGSTAQVIIGYRGIFTLAYRQPGLTLLPPRVVYEGDGFKPTFGTRPEINHTPEKDINKRGELTHVYSVAYLGASSIPSIEVLNKADVEESKRRSQAWQRGQRDKTKQNSPWYTDEAAMWRKTVILRHAKYLPLSAEMARVIELDDQHERGIAQSFQPSNFELPALGSSEQADELARRLEAEGSSTGAVE